MNVQLDKDIDRLSKEIQIELDATTDPAQREYFKAYQSLADDISEIRAVQLRKQQRNEER